ncbi:hypothetical protein D1872_37530 [compost metagenome]
MNRVQLKGPKEGKTSEYVMMSDGYLTIKSMKENANIAHHDEMDRRVAVAESMQSINDHNERITEREISESHIPIMLNKLDASGKLTVFKEILFEMYKGAMIPDPDFVESHEEQLRESFFDYIDEKGGLKLLESAVRVNKSPWLQELKTLVESVSSSVVRRKYTEIREGNTQPQNITFELDCDEKDRLNLGKQDLNVDEISDLVKSKVLTVIKDEQERQKKQDQLFQDLEEESANITGDGNVTESKKSLFIEKPIVEESTLFNSIFRHICKEYVSENLSIASQDSDDDIDPDDVDVNADSKDAAKGDGSSISTDPDSNNDDIELLNDDELDIDMDLILVESICQYTMSELLYTIQLENYTRQDVRQISQQLLR